MRPQNCEERKDERPSEHDTSTDRRGFLKLSSASAVFLGGVGAATTPIAAKAHQVDEGGPSNPDNWELAFEDTFDSGSLDRWNVGWGWGKQSSNTVARITSENVAVQDGTLQLSGTHNGDDVMIGGVNTKGNVEFGPGSYVEAKLRFPERTGFHPSFWAKPVSEAWPPELDIVELIQDGSGRDDVTTSRHFVHYSVSTEPDDESTHEKVNKFYQPGNDLTKNFHVYAAEWRSDHITYYVDGQEIGSWTDSTILESFRKGAPFYVNLTNSVNVDSELNDALGRADLSEAWGETLEVEWMRVWER
jgi:beta-glucanase (GH16 family)